jgi:hypothetical protein
LESSSADLALVAFALVTKLSMDIHDRRASSCEEAGAFLESFLESRANGAEHIPLALDVRVTLTRALAAIRVEANGGVVVPAAVAEGSAGADASAASLPTRLNALFG